MEVAKTVIMGWLITVIVALLFKVADHLPGWAWETGMLLLVVYWLLKR